MFVMLCDKTADYNVNQQIPLILQIPNSNKFAYFNLKLFT